MFTGSVIAFVMPMDEKGKVCRSNLKELTDYHVASDTPVIVSVGTTDEFAILGHDEHGDMVMITLELANGCISVTTGAGANATAEAISLTQCFNDSGVAGYLTMTSYYNRLTQEGLFQHLKAITEYTSLLQTLYNVPSRISYDILPETVGHLTKVKNIVAIKEATGSLSCAHQIEELVLDDFTLLSGDDATRLDLIQLGGHDVISVTSDVAARDMAEMCKLTAAGQSVETRVINQRLMPLYNKLSVEPNPIPMKQACKELGLVTTDMLRLPMTPIADNARGIAKTVLKHAGLP